MGGDNSKLGYRNAVIQLTTKTQPVDSNDNNFWDQFWTEYPMSIQDIFALIPAAEIRALRTEAPNNLATLCYKAVERISQVAESASLTSKDQLTVLNCTRLLTRLLPYIFEDIEWRSFFWSPLPADPSSVREGEFVPLAQSLLSALCDLLFCPDFTVNSISKTGPDGPEDMHTIDSCEYIWQSGVGFAQTPAANAVHDSNRTEILKLILTCFSETMYLEQEEAHRIENKWVTFFTSTANRHALPLFTSLLNVVCAYDPVGSGLPYNHLMFSDSREPLVEVALQILCITLEPDTVISTPTYSNASLRDTNSTHSHPCSDADEQVSLNGTRTISQNSGGAGDVWNNEINLFVNYMSRLHRDEDFAFILLGLTRLLNNPLTQTYLPGSSKKIQMHQELLVLFWRMCECNKKFMYYVLKSSHVLDLIVPILYHLNNSRNDQSRIGLIHVGVFILLLLSGTRNFGVRLNKPYRHRSLLDIPVFTGTHADLLVIVSHKLITSGHNRLNPLFDCLLTIIANVSPYLKSLSMVSSNKLLHLLDAFSQPWFLYSSPSNYQLVFLLLEVFNNIVQYQFDGNSNLVYTLIRKRQIFFRLANLPTDQASINSVVKKQIKSSQQGVAAAGGGGYTTIDSSASVTSRVSVGEIRKSTDSSTGQPISEMSNRLSMESNLPGTPPSTPTESIGQVSSQLNEVNINAKSGDIIQTSLADIPPLHKMTDQHLGNAGEMPEYYSNLTDNNHHNHKHSNSNNSDDNNDEIENNLISHSSPGQRISSTPVDNNNENENNSNTSSSSNNNNNNNKDAHKQSIDDDGDNDNEQSSSSYGTAMSESCSLNRLNRSKEVLESSLNSNLKSHHSSGATTSTITTVGSKEEDEEEGLHTSHPIVLLGDDVKSTKSSDSLLHSSNWQPTTDWICSWKAKMPLQTIMRLLQVLVPQVEKMCIDKGLTDETEIVRFLQNGTLVGLLPVPHPILIRKYQSNIGTTIWFRNYLWGLIYLRNVNPPIWYDTNVRLFEIQRM
uniref:Protein HID1 n=1 Tax=Trichobilharzia regenti TaxID=157069 RepID=A0AA85J397_TRIRE|nr:unnamed protein product [Trichobilharzia regenti]